MANICFVINEGVIDIFHDKVYILAIEKLPFPISNVMISVHWNVGIL